MAVSCKREKEPRVTPEGLFQIAECLGSPLGEEDAAGLEVWGSDGRSQWGMLFVGLWHIRVVCESEWGRTGKACRVRRP